MSAGARGIHVMHACIGQDALLRLLDGELDAAEHGRIVAHIEDCRECQDHLERLTRGLLAPDGESTLESAIHDPGPYGEATKVSGQGWDIAEDEATGEGCRAGAATDTYDDRTDPGNRDAQQAAPDHRAEASSQWPTVPGYDILQRQGEGGMGVVYRARQVGLNRLVALKMIRGGSQARSDCFTRFRVEAESVARLRHPNIIQIYDIGEAAGLPFVALELLDGGSLDDRLRGDPQPGRHAAELMITLARAVQVAHEAGIIHRDLKPANVLYTSDEVPKITDFGLAKRVDSDAVHTQTGQIMGSPSYMAPEQARGHSRDVGPAADIYALGAILYQMLTGRPPFKGQTLMETVRLVIDDDPVTPSRLVPHVPRDVETICLKCLHKDPARRYATARALAEDLKRHLDGEPIEARRTPAWERGAKWVRRRPLHAATAAALLVTIFGAVTGLFAYQGDLLRQSRAIAAASTRGARLLETVSAATARDDVAALEDAQDRISRFLSDLGTLPDDPQVKLLMDGFDAKQGEVRRHLADVRRREADGQQLAAAVRRLQDFRTRLDDVLFQDTHFTGLDLPRDQGAIRRAAVAALDLYAAPGSGDSWALGLLPAGLGERDRAAIAEGCYELLLVLSQVEETPERGLRRLDQAARLRPTPTRSYHSRRAACLRTTGHAGAAEAEHREAERLEPTTPFDHYLAGRDDVKRGALVAALRHFDQALRDQPDHFWARCLSAICWHQLGYTEAARAGYTACLMQEREFAWLYFLRGVTSTEVPPRASRAEIQLLSQAAEADFGRAVELLDQRPNLELRYALLVNRGVLRSRHKAWKAAAADLIAAIDLGDTGALASGNLAKLYLDQGRYAEAFEVFTRAIQHRPNWPPLYRGRAEMVLRSKDPSPARRAQALSDLDRAIGLEKPDNPVLALDYTTRSKLLAMDGHLTEALAACEAAIERVRDYPDAHLLRLEVLRQLKRHDDVIRSCDPLIARGTATAAIYERRALAREAIRDYSGAIEDFTAAMGLRGDRARLLRHRGWVYILADAPQLALHDFVEAIGLDSSSGDAYNGRGFARLRFGEHRAGVADAERALSLGEPTPELFYKAARVYALAAVVVSAEARQKGQESLFLVNRYQGRAADLLREAIRRLPADRRTPFVKDVILADPDLKTLRRRLSSMDLAGTVLPREAPGGEPVR
jgi:tetratricopeptide (TPR) repeat protein